MNEYLRLARLYMIVLAIFTMGRLVTGFRGVPYERGHAIFSLVTMSFLSSALYGAFSRKWLGYSVTKAMGLRPPLRPSPPTLIPTLPLPSIPPHPHPPLL